MRGAQALRHTGGLAACSTYNADLDKWEINMQENIMACNNSAMSRRWTSGHSRPVVVQPRQGAWAGATGLDSGAALMSPHAVAAAAGCEARSRLATEGGGPTVVAQNAPAA